MTPENDEIIGKFHALYSGGLAQSLRDSGKEPLSMPPWSEVYWLGKQVVKCPMDLWVYQEIIVETRPELIIETGTSGSGSAYFFATIFDMMDWPGHIVTIDATVYPDLRMNHPRITYLEGDSVGDVMFKHLTNVFQPAPRTMVSLDSLHTYEHVKRELELYAPLVTPGCYLVVEDTGWSNPKDTPTGGWADRAAKEFLRDNPGYVSDVSREKHLITSNRGGWIRRES